MLGWRWSIVPTDHGFGSFCGLEMIRQLMILSYSLILILVMIMIVIVIVIPIYFVFGFWRSPSCDLEFFLFVLI